MTAKNDARLQVLRKLFSSINIIATRSSAMRPTLNVYLYPNTCTFVVYENTVVSRHREDQSARANSLTAFLFVIDSFRGGNKLPISHRCEHVSHCTACSLFQMVQTFKYINIQ